MKHPKHYTEPYDPEEDEEYEQLTLDVGFAAANEGEGVEVRAYTCPGCKRVLFEADIDLHGVIFIKCRRCRREVAIPTQSERRPIGFSHSYNTQKEIPKC